MTIIPWNLSSSDGHMSRAPKQDLGGHKLKDDLEVKTAVTRWKGQGLISTGTDIDRDYYCLFHGKRDA